MYYCCSATEHVIKWPIYSLVARDETDKEVNVKARLPAWAKGKSVVLDMTQTHIKLSLKEEEEAPIIEVQYIHQSILRSFHYRSHSKNCRHIRHCCP